MIVRTTSSPTAGRWATITTEAEPAVRCSELLDAMPGPVSDSYDPEFSTGENAQDVRDAIIEARDKLAIGLGEPQNIISVARFWRKPASPNALFLLPNSMIDRGSAMPEPIESTRGSP